MAARLFPFARAIVDFKVTDTWDPAGTDHRKDEWIGGVYYDYDATDGYLVYRCVKNTSSATIGSGLMVTTEAGETNIDHVIIGAATQHRPRVRGVTVSSIAVGHCGFVICKGKATAKNTTGSVIAANAAIKTVANGLIDDAVIGTDAIIGSNFAEIADGASGKVYLDVL
tara:strand:- start:5508 stop:6014 length:507 start_codon:yes stop_codon:yes gene_type:complete